MVPILYVHTLMEVSDVFFFVYFPMSSLTTSVAKQQFKGLSICVGAYVQNFLMSIHSKLLS